MKRKNSLFTVVFFGIIAANSFGQSSATDTVNATKGVQTTVSRAYFKMGDMRLLNNDWGSRAQGCNSSYKIFINTDGSFGWEFTRGACGGGGSQPDFPEVEFGIHPFGTAKNLVTSPDFPSTKVLPLQIKDIKSASVKLDQMTIALQNAASWDICFEMWFTTQNPVTGTHNCAYAEIMAFWGWETGRWPCDQTGNLTAGTNSYVLCHKADGWGCGWKYYQYSVNGGPLKTYNGTLDVKAMLDWLVSNAGMSKDLWISRFEIGSEIGDNTSGKVTIKNVTFEVNGVSKSPEFSNPTAVREKSPDAIPQKWTAAIFPAGTSVEIVNMQGMRRFVQTGPQAKSAAELGKCLSRGIYYMVGTDRKDPAAKKTAVVPVL